MPLLCYTGTVVQQLTTHSAFRQTRFWFWLHSGATEPWCYLVNLPLSRSMDIRLIGVSSFGSRCVWEKRVYSCVYWMSDEHNSFKGQTQRYDPILPKDFCVTDGWTDLSIHVTLAGKRSIHTGTFIASILAAPEAFVMASAVLYSHTQRREATNILGINFILKGTVKIMMMNTGNPLVLCSEY